MSDQVLIGVDGGKSKTVCVAANAGGQVTGWGRSGSSDKYDVPFEQAVDAIEACTRQALEMAGASPNQVTACFGLAGADWPEDLRQYHAALEQRHLARQLLVKNDAAIALRAGAPEGYGVVVSAGTHLAAAIRTPRGREWHSAWFSVEGAGGVWVGHKALWAVLKAEDGRARPTALTELVLQAIGLNHPLDLLRVLSRGEMDDNFKASLAPLVFTAYQQYSDPVAEDILRETARDMAAWPLALLARYNLQDTPMPVVLSGGLFKAECTLLIEELTALVHEHYPLAEIRLAQREPVAGAVLIAAELAGVPAAQAFLDQLDASLPSASFFNTKNTA